MLPGLHVGVIKIHYKTILEKVFQFTLYFSTTSKVPSSYLPILNVKNTILVIWWKWLLLFSCWVMSNSLQAHGLQPTRFSVHGISQARIWSGLPFPSPGDFPDPGIEPASPALQEDCLLLRHLGSSHTEVVEIPNFIGWTIKLRDNDCNEFI